MDNSYSKISRAAFCGCFFAVFFLLMTSFPIKTLAYSWLYDNGKWYLYYTYDDPVENEWVDYGGNRYHIEGEGLMSTDKWFSDDDTGKTHYLGTDGIMQRNCYTASGDKFVGADGAELKSFDKWREEAKKSLKKVVSDLNRKVTVTSQQKEFLASLNATNAAFTLYDLNGDGYRDIIVINAETENSQVLDIKLWNSEEEEFYTVMELDFVSDETAELRREEQQGNVWMIVSKDMNDYNFFSMNIGDYDFTSVEHYYFDFNEYGDIVYYIDEDKVSASDWNTSLIHRRAETGKGIFANYHSMDDDSIKEQVDMYPSEDELQLFQEREAARE
ncbi:hypothetical protein [Oribacterium sp. WCC10]|uniref:hypothetical protein n=1 Tax=Oribacterium sp. WCC10 TaxID=1855343 RepID=UPI0008F1A10D|nr:hypothetical protein [Oribacterium sp. WCC10]SFG24683.1 hypothetical protein SAMN05216356_10452 [Oribacterium sp. WCC10]